MLDFVAKISEAVQRFQSTQVVVPKPSVETAVETSVQTVGRLQHVGPNKGGYWQVLE